MTKQEFDKLPQVDILIDGSPVRMEPGFGASVWDDEFKHAITPIAYASRHFREFWK